MNFLVYYLDSANEIDKYIEDTFCRYFKDRIISLPNVLDVKCNFDAQEDVIKLNIIWKPYEIIVNFDNK